MGEVTHRIAINENEFAQVNCYQTAFARDQFFDCAHVFRLNMSGHTKNDSSFLTSELFNFVSHWHRLPKQHTGAACILRSCIRQRAPL